MSETVHIERNETPCYTYGPHYEPVAHLKPGDRAVIQTYDAFGDRVLRDGSEGPGVAGGNPQTGPIAIEDAEPGDTLAVHLESIEFTRDYAVSAFVPNFGGLVATRWTRMVLPPLERETFIYPVEGDKIVLDSDVRIPARPFCGTMGTSPERESISTSTPGDWGGNMDCADVCPGNVMHFQVRVPEAHFFTGDVHAAQGDGELCGVACEIPARVTVRFELLKQRATPWPRIISDTHLMVVGSARPLEDAARIAWCELIDWLGEDYEIDWKRAYQLLTQAGEMRLANMVDPQYSMCAKIRREYVER